MTSFILLLLSFIFIMTNQLVNGIVFLILLVLSLLSLYIFKYTKDKDLLQIMKNDLEVIISILSKLFLIIIFIVLIVIGFSFKEIDHQVIRFLCYQIFYICFIIFYFVIMNYLGTSSLSIRNNLKCLIININEFFNKNFLLNILILIILSVLKISSNIGNDLFFGILGSYLFFMLTEVNNIYVKDKMKVETYEIIFQFVLNIVLIFTFSDFEKFWNHAYLEELITLTLYGTSIRHIILLIVVLWLSNHTKWIGSLC